MTPTELAVLAAVHRADEEEGGLATDTLTGDEQEALDALVRGGLVDLVAEDDDPASHAGYAGYDRAIARISWRGVEALRDAGVRR